MTRHDPLVRVRHMLDHAREAVEMVRGRFRAELDSDRQLNLGGRKVEMTTPKSLSKYFRDEVLREAEVQYVQT